MLRHATVTLTLAQVALGCSWFEVDEKYERSDAAPPATVGRLEVPALAAGDQFGSAVAGGPDLIAVGAPGDDRQETEAGAVHFFSPSGESWSEEAVLVDEEGRAGDQFGAALAFRDDLLAVGAPGRDEDGSWSGAVYVYRRDGPAWRRVATLFAPDPATGSRFGTSVAFVGPDLLAIGASGHDGDESGAGATYMFQRQGDAWEPLR